MRTYNKYMYTNKRCVQIPIIVVHKAVSATEMYNCIIQFNEQRGTLSCLCCFYDHIGRDTKQI